MSLETANMKASDEKVAIEHAQTVIKNLDQVSGQLVWFPSFNELQTSNKPIILWCADGERVQGEVHGA